MDAPAADPRPAAAPAADAHAAQHGAEEPPAPPASRLATAVWIIASLVLVAVIVGLWLNLRSGSSGADISAAIVRGERPDAPPIPTRGIDGDGAPAYDAARARGHVLVVNFWASWCGPCETEAPVLQRVSEEYDGRVTVVGLDAGSEDVERDARDFVRKHDLTFPIVRGDRGDKAAWGIGGYPETFIVGVDGRLSAHVDGAVDRDNLRALLDRELEAERTPA